MGHKFKEVIEESPIVLSIHANDKHMDLGAVVKKHLGQNLTLISLNYSGAKRLVFDNVQIDALYCPSDSVPILWHNVKIINHKNSYLLQTSPHQISDITPVTPPDLILAKSVFHCA